MKKFFVIVLFSLCTLTFYSCGGEGEMASFWPTEIEIQGVENLTRKNAFDTYGEISADGGEIILKVVKEVTSGFSMRIKGEQNSEYLFLNFPWDDNFHIGEEYSASWGSVQYLSTNPQTVVLIKINPNSSSSSRYIKFSVEAGPEGAAFHLTQSGK